MSTGVGFLLAASSAILNGSFVVFSKLPSVKAAGVDPLVFQMYTSFGVFFSSLLTLPFIHGSLYPLPALGWGILAGGLFVCAVAFSFVAVQLVGLSIGQGIWSGSAVLISFVWGVAAFGDQVKAPIAGAGLALIVAGVLGIAMCSDIAKRLGGGDSTSLGGEGSAYGGPNGTQVVGGLDDMSSSLLDGTITPAHHRNRTGGSVDLDAQLVHPAAQKANGAKFPYSMPNPNPLSTTMNGGDSPLSESSAPNLVLNGSSSNAWGRVSHSNTDIHMSMPLSSASSYHDSVDRADLQDEDEVTEDEAVAEAVSLRKQRQIYGSACALLVGVFGGSILMPLQLAPEEYRGLQFVPSFGVGTLLIAPLITLPYMWLSRSSGSRGNWAVRESFLPGVMAGTVWNAANVCSIFAISRVGYAVGYPLMQCAIAVAALWGVLVFKEIQGKQIIVMAVSSIVVLGGAVLLALSKQ